MPSSLNLTLRSLWAREKFTYGIRVFIALAGSMALCWYLDRIAFVIPLFLGCIASALAESDDHWRGRLQALLVTLLCFAATATAVQLLFPYPWLFGAGLALAAFAMTLLGGIGERYAAVASATLILAIYTAIGLEHRGGALGSFWQEPLLLIAGAAWYGVLGVIWSALFSQQPVQQALARVFIELGAYLRLKASLFEPLRQLDVEGRRLQLAQQNGRVVSALNQAKEIILNRMSRKRSGQKTNRYLKLYFIAQDIHERASSSHYPYNALAEAFFHSDVMFRCGRLISQQGKACQALGTAIRMRQPFDYNDNSQAMADLDTSMAYLREQNNPAWRRLLRSLNALAGNLATLERKLASASNPDALADEQDSSLLDRSPQSLKDAFERLRLHFSPTSLVFRHALRLSVALAAGYGLLHWVHPQQGYWILLTTLFVCRPSYGATRLRLVQRVGGTLLGLVAGWALISLFPEPLLQSLFAVVAGVVFFTNRVDRYTLATSAMTLVVVLCFNQVSDGYALIWPRLVDTLLGTLIAGLAVFFILPDWQGRKLNQVLANTLSSNGRYLLQIMQQYESGKRDDLSYRLARRNAHNADAALSTTLSNMLMEPGHFRKDAETGFRFLVLSHTLLSYLSGLGAHRETLADDASDALHDRAVAHISATLEDIAGCLRDNRPVAVYSETDQALAEELEQLPEDMDEGHRLVQVQLGLICRQLAPLRTLLAHLQQRQPEPAPTKAA
ncbi:TIGR01666 family membrane protein [Pseudomonas sp. R-28-1W-6]|uniref:YccS family putative transporter n=1 Tax=Pseudomonas sp. R-28-1W-6 TaxID=2650101 RepID=UPI001365C9D7|nr:YccS family putative transporter [Pseudomonas sp. R-28-1W-6]MWV10492.1 TIGR01666 family membrane protein [Pseudomonas sp. R-28-1W-6]